MNLSPEAFKEARRRPGSVCAVFTIRQSLAAKEREAVDAALADASIAAAAIARVLTDAGHRVAPNTVQHHRRGDCRCGKGDQE